MNSIKTFHHIFSVVCLLISLETPCIVMAAVLPGVPCDYNGDGVCDAADYVVWRNNLGTNNVILNDPTPGNVDQSDYDFWRTRFGNTAGSGAAVTVTPEPSTFFLAITALATLSTRRRKPNSQANPRW